MNTINLRQIHNYKSNIIYPYGIINELRHNPKRVQVKSCEGIYLYGDDGKKYIDVISGLWNVSLGYSQKTIIDSIKQQLDELCFCSLFDHTNENVIRNAQKLLSIHDEHFSKISYTCSGSESLELAIKIIRKYWHVLGEDERKTIVSFEGSYHGTSYGALSLSQEEKHIFNAYGPGIPDIVGIPVCRKPTCDGCDGCICNKSIDWIQQNANNIAGIVIEPILLSVGITDLSKVFLTRLMDICISNHILVAIDEVATGFYRTGPAFCYQRYGIKPDIVCMSKAINSGYLPLGAVAIAENCVNVLSNWLIEDFLHGSTQCGNVLSIAASNTSLEIYDRIFSNDEVCCRTKYFANTLGNIIEKHHFVEKVLFNGNLVLIKLSDDGKLLDLNLILEFRNALKQNGVISYASVEGLLFLPMYITQISEYNDIIDIISKVFHCKG